MDHNRIKRKWKTLWHQSKLFFFVMNKLIKRDILKHIGYIPNTYRLPDWKVAMSNEQFRSFSDHGKPSPLSGELLKNSSLPQHFFFVFMWLKIIA
jgi:hypothetical protein